MCETPAQAFFCETCKVLDNLLTAPGDCFWWYKTKFENMF